MELKEVKIGDTIETSKGKGSLFRNKNECGYEYSVVVYIESCNGGQGVYYESFLIDLQREGYKISKDPMIKINNKMFDARFDEEIKHKGLTLNGDFWSLETSDIDPDFISDFHKSLSLEDIIYDFVNECQRKIIKKESIYEDYIKPSENKFLEPALNVCLEKEFYEIASEIKKELDKRK